jgi:hypothetical protein
VLPSTSTLPLTSLTVIACGIACNSRITRYRGLDLPAGCGRSALLVRIDLDVRTVRIECHFNEAARGLCLWSGPMPRETEGPSA